MLLPADRQLSFELQRAGGHDPQITSGQPQRRGEEAFTGNGILDGEDCGQLFVLRHHAGSTATGPLQRVGEGPGDRLSVEHHLGGKQRLVVACRSRIPLTTHIVSREHRQHAGFVRCSRHVETHETGVRMGGEHRPGVEEAGKAPEQVVRVERLASDMASGALVRNGPAHQRHARPSHQNFSTRLFATASRYSFDPR